MSFVRTALGSGPFFALFSDMSSNELKNIVSVLSKVTALCDLIALVYDFERNELVHYCH
mgnify:CR=1 FL=1